GQSTFTVCPAMPLAGTVIFVFPKITPRAGGTGLIRNSLDPETVLPVDVLAEAVNLTVPLPAVGLKLYFPFEPLNPDIDAVIEIAPSAPFTVAEIGLSK